MLATPLADVPPMLARLSRELPAGDFLYEPKWDGFRAIVARDRDDVRIASRHGRPLARYFPEIVEAVRSLGRARFVLDGELVVATANGFDFPALMARLHPSSTRVERLRAQTPASLIAFDALLDGDDALLDVPFEDRRRRLEALLRDARAPIHLTPLTDDPGVARRWLERFAGGGVDGVVAKHRLLRYQPGKRAMVKVKRERTADCVVAGFRWLEAREELGSLLLGLYDDAGELRHVGVVTSFTAARRREVQAELEPLVTPLEGHPWEQGFGLERSPLGRLLGAAGRWTPGMSMDWVPIRPDRVAEVAFDAFEGDRFRHPARLRRWRPDRDPRSCTFDQLRTTDAPVVGLGHFSYR